MKNGLHFFILTVLNQTQCHPLIIRVIKLLCVLINSFLNFLWNLSHNLAKNCVKS